LSCSEPPSRSVSGEKAVRRKEELASLTYKPAHGRQENSVGVVAYL
jgi:hypothetical protein